jgi:hypothetical protein
VRLQRGIAPKRLFQLLAPPAAFAAFIAVGRHVPSICLFQTFAGIPCPGCGITRALVQIVDGNFAAAFALNPAAFAVAAYFIATAVAAPLENGARFRLLADRFLLVSLLSTWLARSIP